MIPVVVIDDEPLARSLVIEYLQSYPGMQVVAECADGFEGLKAIQQLKPALIFLDIQMPKISGFEMLELLEEPPAVIFTTAFDEYAIKAFEANAVDYLLKPFGKDRFDRAIQKWQLQAGEQRALQEMLLQQGGLSAQQHERIVVKTGHQIRIIPLHEVVYLEAADDYVKVHTAEASYLKNKTMGWFEANLNAQQFVRVHRSYLLGVKHIARLDPYEKESYVATLRQGQRIPVSKAGYSRLKEVLGL
ncbi:MAG: LytTR family transcriptional regulator DNA-binding domain-containing protein [Chitinophagaceae bacterium]|nr:LytTR family transcriptional regulator DNA-binding domain-containing protein [Chitinophagaceae bacterium]